MQDGTKTAKPSNGRDKQHQAQFNIWKVSLFYPRYSYIFLFYSIVLPEKGGQDRMFMVFMISCVHAIILFVAGIIMIFMDKTRSLGLALVLSFLLLMGIGFLFYFGHLGG